ncbi:MAG: hypothetical protein GKR88_17045 [Flavobacteriaceae bacterium]|nr:MAG: hypothetical protein GKR88_17045 [Flavobacteriaceae bacterium]
MKKIGLIFCATLLILLLVKCTNQEERVVSEALFNIDNIKNIYVDSFEDENLNNQGYKREVADVLIYEKKVKDTLVQLQFTDEAILYKTWYITLNSSNLNNAINEILYNNGVLALKDFERCTEKKEPYSFPVVGKNNNLFLCNVYKEEGKDYLKIVYYNPLLKSD